MTQNILVTGGCGFLGSHFVEHVHKNTDWNIYIIDKLSYAANGLERLRDSNLLFSNRIKVFTYDFSYPLSDGIIRELGNIDYIVHIAADSHVDYSIKNPVETIRNNVMSTVYLLEYARKLPNLKLFFYFSTDETYGSTLESFTEKDKHNPGNPYSASKSAAEQICNAYHNTYKVPLITVNCMNIYGERQYVEKFIPKCIKYILEGKTLTIHTNKEGMPGSRFYIHARNVSDAVFFLIHNGTIGETYNIPGEREINNLEMTEYIAKEMNMPVHIDLESEPTDRPGVDFRYCLDGSKLFDLGWKHPVSIDVSLKKTIQWTLNNKKWLEE